MSAERTLVGLVYPDKIEDMERELTEVIEDFDRAVHVEALRLAKQAGEHSSTRSGDSPSYCSCRAEASS